MQSKLNHRVVKRLGRATSCSVLSLGLALTLSTTGCVSSLQKHSAALANATAPVVDGAATAYRNAEKLHDMRENYDAVDEFDPKDTSAPVYNPRHVQPLMTDRQIQVRLTVLAAFQAYTRSLVEITNGTSSPELDEAARSAGGNLSALGDTLAPSIESTFGIVSNTTTQTTVVTTQPGSTSTAATTSTSPNGLPSGAAAGIQVAVKALAEFLVSKKIKSQLPGIVKAMDPNVDALCKLLSQDLDTLQSQEHIDFDSVIGRQTFFLRQSGSSPRYPAVDPGVRREQIMQLPQIARLQQATDAQLTDLKASIMRLDLTHHALAADAQGNNPESLKAKLSELAAVGGTLGKF